MHDKDTKNQSCAGAVNSRRTRLQEASQVVDEQETALGKQLRHNSDARFQHAGCFLFLLPQVLHHLPSKGTAQSKVARIKERAAALLHTRSMRPLDFLRAAPAAVVLSALCSAGTYCRHSIMPVDVANEARAQLLQASLLCPWTAALAPCRPASAC